MTEERKIWPDILKGIAIVLVVFGHCLKGNLQFEAQYPRLYDSACFFIWHFHTQTFFFAAGFFINRWLSKPFKEAIWCKFSSLMVPYFCWTLILGGVYIGLGMVPSIAGSVNNSVAVQDVLWSPVRPILSLWFLRSLFISQVIFWGLKRYLNRWWILVPLAAVVILMDEQRLLHCVYLGLGYLFRSWWSQMTWSESKVRIISAVTVILFLAVNIPLAISVYEAPATSFVMALLGILSLVIISMSLEKSALGRHFAYLGKLSMAIYLIHGFISPATRIILHKFTPFDPGVTNTVLATVAGVWGSIAAHAVIMKMTNWKFLFGGR